MKGLLLLILEGNPWMLTIMLTELFGGCYASFPWSLILSSVSSRDIGCINVNPWPVVGHFVPSV